MTSLVARTRWMVLLAWCCCFNTVALLARPVRGESATDEAVATLSKSVETAAGPKTALSFPSALPAEMPFRGDAELFSSATRATGSVVILVGLILIGSFLLKRYWPGRFGAVPGERHIEVLETVALGERQSLTLVQVGRSRLLLARTAGCITLLDRAELTTEAVVDTVLEASVERLERHGNKLAVVLNGSAGLFRRVEARLKAGLARVWALLLQKPRNKPAEKSPSFEQVMRAELNAAASSTARTRSSARSRLAEIRSQLQAE